MAGPMAGEEREEACCGGAGWLIEEAIGLAPHEVDIDRFSRYSVRPFYRCFGSLGKAVQVITVWPDLQTAQKRLKEQVLPEWFEGVLDKAGRNPAFDSYTYASCSCLIS